MKKVQNLLEIVQNHMKKVHNLMKNVQIASGRAFLSSVSSPRESFIIQVNVQ